MPLPSQRDRSELRRRLCDWLATKLPEGAAPEISDLSVPESSGFSSETLMFDATWTEDGARRSGRYVARTSPDMSDWPVFPAYDLELQHRVLDVVREHTDVPVPEAPWIELDAGPLGTPFMLMKRIEGIVPADNPPYVFDGWVKNASPAERARLQRSSVEVLAKLHAIDLEKADTDFLDRPRFGASALDQHLGYQRFYYDWAREGERFPFIEKTFDWLDANRPAQEEPRVLNWGDSRIGNIMYRDFEPVAVLDWEMAALGARAVDVAWMVHMHDFFVDIAGRAGLPGIDGFLTRDDVVGSYEALSGTTLRDFEYYAVFAGLRYMIVSIRTSLRGIAYEQMERPADLDDMLMNKPVVERMMAGEQWN